MIYLAENLKYLLKSNGLKQENLASITGKSRSTAGSYVRGRANPDAEILVIIAKYFNISLDDLVLSDLVTAYKHQDKVVDKVPNVHIVSDVNYSDQYQSTYRKELDLLKEQVNFNREHMRLQQKLIETLQKALDNKG